MTSYDYILESANQKSFSLSFKANDPEDLRTTRVVVFKNEATHLSLFFSFLHR